MIYTEDKALQKKIEAVYTHNQEQIFRFWDQLDDGRRANLLAQVSQIDFVLLERLITQAQNKQMITHTGELEPPQVITLDQRTTQDSQAREAGAEVLRQGKVAAFLVAGGQGTRLGFDGPKGMYPVTPVRKKSLFQLHAEKILAIGRKYETAIQWFIMTSQTNNEQTEQFFKKNNYFGLQPAEVHFFIQEMVPAIDRQGKLILDRPDHIFMNPNGHGGSIKALDSSGALRTMKKQGIEYIFYFQVDNVLTRICDPVYIGYHVLDNSEMSCKVVRKKYPEEKMGVVCRIGEKLHLVEYSDLGEKEMYATNPDGSPKFWVGSIAMHLFNRTFLERENEGGFKLPYHLAEKNISYLDEAGKLIKPEEKNGIKFETFVFDALSDARTAMCLEIVREEEFSPLKNKEGENSPET
ncbi:MAG: UDPGP type 1 family protein, partial [Calditrichales bacterium]